MNEPSHRAAPGPRPSLAQRREYDCTSTDAAAARNNMSVTDCRTYASLIGETTHPLRKPAGLLVLSIAIAIGEIRTTLQAQTRVNHVAGTGAQRGPGPAGSRRPVL